MRWFLAHLAALLTGSLLLVAGVEMLAFGPDRLFDGAGKWAGGLLVFAAIAIVTAPLGMLLRYLAGRLPVPALASALGIGAVVGVALIPVLHPSMAPTLSMETAPVALLLLHALAGVAGGLVWYGVEKGAAPELKA